MELGLGVYEETEVETDFNEVGLEPLITSTTSVVVEDSAVHDDASGAAVQSWSQSYPAPPPATYRDAAFATGGSPPATTSADIEQAGKLFLGGISWQTDEHQLTSYFSSFGELLDVAVMRNKVTGMSRGFGFITFRNADSVETVLSREHHLDGRRIDIKQAVPRDRAPPAVERTQRPPTSMYGHTGGAHQSNPQYQHQSVPLSSQQQHHDPLGGSGSGQRYRGGVGAPHQYGNEGGTRKLFVGGIPPTVTENEFRQYFERFGVVNDAVVMYDRNTLRSRGFGFVTYSTIESAHAVLATAHELQGKFVEVKEAEPKEVMNMHQGGGSQRQNHHHHQQQAHQHHANYQQQQQQQYAADQYHLMAQQQHYPAQQGGGGGGGGGGSGSPYGNPMDSGNVQLGPDAVYHDSRTGLPLSNQQRSTYSAPQQLGGAGYHDPYQHSAYQQQYGQQQQPQTLGGDGVVQPSDLSALTEQQYVATGGRGIVDGYDTSQQAGLADTYSGYQQPQALGSDPQQQQQYAYGHSQDGFGGGGYRGGGGGQGAPPRNHDNRSYRPYNG